MDEVVTVVSVIGSSGKLDEVVRIGAVIGSGKMDEVVTVVSVIGSGKTRKDISDESVSLELSISLDSSRTSFRRAFFFFADFDLLTPLPRFAFS